MANENTSQKTWQTYVSLGLSALGVVFFLIQALSLSIVLLVNLAEGQQGPMQAISLGLILWSALLSSVLLLPVLILSWHRLKGDEVPNWLKMGRPDLRKAVFWVIIIWPVVVALGWLIAGRPMAATFLLGPINILVAGLPVLWIFNAAGWKLDGGPRLRQWQIFGFSLTVVPFLVILFEIIAVLILVMFGWLYLNYRISIDPGLERDLTLLVDQISASGQDINQLLQVIETNFLQPSVLFWAAAVMGGVMPIIEEIVKPIALWPLAGKDITPQEGFIGGVLCGAGFALTENLLYFNMAVNAEEWLYMAIGRAGTGILHMLASGLVGWGLVNAWRSGNWGSQALLTLASFILHSLWNVLVLFVGFAPGLLLESDPTFWQAILFNVPIILLLILSLVGLYLINRNFRNKNSNDFIRENDKLQEDFSAPAA
ncbi:MAG: PrsW family glutamic-type intramembrane protease [Brevefilum sp.]